MLGTFSWTFRKIKKNSENLEKNKNSTFMHYKKNNYIIGIFSFYLSWAFRKIKKNIFLNI